MSTVVCAITARSAVGLESVSTVVIALSARNVVVVEVKRATTPEREAAKAKIAAGDEGEEEEPAAKRVKTTEAGPVESMTDLEKLLAEKKRQLMAKLQQKKGPVEVD